MHPFIDDILEKINSYDFSTLEKLLYAYDCVNDDDIIIEKNEALLDILIENKISCIKKNNTLIVYLNDKQYDVNGIYFIKEFDRNYYGRYKFLSPNPYSENDLIISNEDLMEVDTSDIINNKDLIGKVNLYSELVDNIKIFRKEKNYTFKDAYAYNKEQVLLSMNKYVALTNKRILADTLVDALFNVRKKQYLDTGDKYPFSKNGFIQTIVESNWKFCNRNESLLFNLFHIDVNLSNEAIEYFENSDMEESIDSVKQKKIAK